jgi:hypothetical protein
MSQLVFYTCTTSTPSVFTVNHTGTENISPSVGSFLCTLQFYKGVACWLTKKLEKLQKRWVSEYGSLPQYASMWVLRLWCNICYEVFESECRCSKETKSGSVCIGSL